MVSGGKLFFKDIFGDLGIWTNIALEKALLSSLEVPQSRDELDVSVGLRPLYWMGKIALTRNMTWQGSFYIFPFTFQILDRNLQNGFDFHFWWRNTENKQ